MMQLTVNINNENLADKIIKLLDIFRDDGVQILNYENVKKLVTTKNNFNENIDSNWKDEIMTNENPNIDDDEILPQAYWEYHNEKYFN
jgi:hypothetical protein